MVCEPQGLAKLVIRVLLQLILNRPFLQMWWMLCSMISVEMIRMAAHRGLLVILNQVRKLHTRLRICGFPRIGPGEQEEE